MTLPFSDSRPALPSAPADPAVDGGQTAPSPDPNAWAEQFAKSSAPAEAPEGATPDIDESDVFTDDEIVEGAAMLASLFLPSEAYPAFARSIDDTIGSEDRPTRAGKILEKLQIGRAAAELGITPSRGFARLPAWAKLVGGLGALAFVIGTAYDKATKSVAPAAQPLAVDGGAGDVGVGHTPGATSARP